MTDPDMHDGDEVSWRSHESTDGGTGERRITERGAVQKPSALHKRD